MSEKQPEPLYEYNNGISSIQVYPSDEAGSCLFMFQYAGHASVILLPDDEVEKFMIGLLRRPSQEN